MGAALVKISPAVAVEGRRAITLVFAFEVVD